MRDAGAPSRALLRAVLLGAAVALPVVALAVVVRGGSNDVVRFDESTVVAATDLTRASPSLRAALVLWQDVLAPRWLNLVVVPLVCVWAWRRHGFGARAAWAGATVAAGWALQLAAKGLVQRARPVIEDAVAHAPGSSFPSGHAAGTTMAALALTVLAWPALRRRGRVTAVAVTTLAIVGAAADRVLLGVHYPSDVVAGTLLGVAVVGASYVGFRGRGTHDPDAAPVSAGRPEGA
ncbi:MULTISPECIES: phosphatase PAP2 family protein [Cellulomonas]|uniref:phosphatase PAP2 family protein n=1 Tax=Cellulomonas TaxID=1707 RepID=UPI000625340B|nr:MULTISPECIES: phosphatase PAP2 family protein [Cellulomonas]